MQHIILHGIGYFSHTVLFAVMFLFYFISYDAYFCVSTYARSTQTTKAFFFLYIYFPSTHNLCGFNRASRNKHQNKQVNVSYARFLPYKRGFLHSK